MNFERGCVWEGELSELSTHHGKCSHQPPPPPPDIGEVVAAMKKLECRVGECERALYEKEKEISYLKVNDAQRFEEIQKWKNFCEEKSVEIQTLKKSDDEKSVEIQTLKNLMMKKRVEIQTLEKSDNEKSVEIRILKEKVAKLEQDAKLREQFWTDQNENNTWFQFPPRFRWDLFLKNKNLRGNENKMLGLRGEISLRGHTDCTFDK